MNKDKQSYSNSTANDSEKTSRAETGQNYQSGKISKENDSHDAFEKSDYSVRKMTFGKIKYVQK